MPANIVWSREELILALELYKECNGKIPDVKHPDIIALASTLADLAMLTTDKGSHAGRDRSSIIFKLANFRSLDPAARSEGKKGFANAGRLDREIWNEFSESPTELKKQVDEIKGQLDAARERFEPLKANIHLLRLVGDELIGSLHLAVFELVKNSYDANAKSAHVVLDLHSDEPFVSVQDDGWGMDLDTIRNGWLQLGGPLKRGNARVRTPVLERMPLGEKGIGRLAAFKLGDCLELITRQKDSDIEYVVIIDLSDLLADGTASGASVEDVRVSVRSRVPRVFAGKKHGTRIRITNLRRDSEWNRRQVRQLHRLVTTLVNPFTARSDAFTASLEVPGYEGWLVDLLGPDDIKSRAIYRFQFQLDEDGAFWWRYKFSPPEVFRTLKGHTLSDNWKQGTASRLDLEPLDDEVSLEGRPPKGKILADADTLRNIGPISGNFYVYDRTREVLKRQGGEPKLVGDFLNEQGGVRVYRDGMRVYNYGEPGDDWLGLNVERVNKPGRKLATNAVIAAIELNAEQSTGLIEKTNREGFDENRNFKQFYRVVNSAVDFLNRTRQKDRDDLNEALKPKEQQVTDPSARFDQTVEDLRKLSRKHAIEKELAPKLNAIVKEYKTLQEAAIGAGAGLNIAILFHEAERGIKSIVEAINRSEDIPTLKKRANNLASLLGGFAEIFRKEKPREITASQFLKRVMDLHQGRFEAHRVTVSCPVLTGEDIDFTLSGSLNYYLSAITNLIDNAIYWTRRAREERGESYTPAIAIRTLTEWAAEGPAIAVLDNGPGFGIEPEMAFRPFVSTRAGGMGLGLYFAKMVMETQGGDLHIIPDVEELDIESALHGAAVAMRFRRVRQ